MAELIRISHEALTVIPQEKWLIIHRMYEDSDLEGVERAEELMHFIEAQAPDTFVGINANNSVQNKCIYEPSHLKCGLYNPYWYIVLISKKVWEQYKDQVEAKDQEWTQKHGCKHIIEAAGA